MFNKAIIAASITVLFSSSVMAADAIVYNEPTPPEVINSFSWTGGYIGVNAGHAWGKSPFRNRFTSGDINDVAGTDYDPDGFFGGLYVGYNKNFSNNVVLGIDADLNIANIKNGGNEYVNYTYNYAYDVNASSKMNWNGAVRARLGYAYDRVLPYIAGGVSFGGYKFDVRNKNNNDLNLSEKSTMTGWNIGTGVEYAATDNIILRAEYRYTDFGNKTFDGLWNRDTAKIKLSTHDVRVGIAYKF